MNHLGRGPIGAISVYKADPPSRSLPDFAQVVEIFDAHSSVNPLVQHDHLNNPLDPQYPTVPGAIRACGHRERIYDNLTASRRKGMRVRD